MQQFKQREWRPYRPTRRLFLRDVEWAAAMAHGERVHAIVKQYNRHRHRSRRVTADYVEWRELELALLLEEFDKPDCRLWLAAKLRLGAEVWTALQIMRRRHWSLEKLIARVRSGVHVPGIGAVRYGHILKIASLRTAPPS